MASDKSYRILSAEEGASLIPNGALVAVSGFTPAGAPKAVPRALAKRARKLHESGEPFQIRLLSGASTGAACPNVPAEILIPRNVWLDKAAYDATAHKLAGLFRNNFATYESGVSAEVEAGGPV